MDLLADIGATTTRCGLLGLDGRLVKSAAYQNAEFPNLEELLSRFLASGRKSDQPKRAALAVAAPILGDEIALLNRDWRFTQTGLSQRLRIPRLIVVNDFAAVARALPVLGDGQRQQIGEQGKPIGRAALGVLGPGSGLGVGGLVPATDGWAVVSGEGGHVTLAAATPLERKIIDKVRREHGHCSAERLLSGPGIVRIYETLAEIRGIEAEPARPADVTARAVGGEPLAAAAMEVFFDLLGSVAGDLALTLGARGGIYVAGGIVPRVAALFARSGFRTRFAAKGRYRSYLEAIPTYLVTEPVPAFFGLRALLGYE